MHTDYLSGIFNNTKRKKIVHAISEHIRVAHKNADILVGTGISGCMLLPELSIKCKMPFAIVRKPIDDSHAKGYVVEGNYDPDNISSFNYIIIDDLICSGNTLNTVKSSIETYFLKRCRHIISEPLAIYLYNQCNYGNTRIPFTFKDGKRVERYSFVSSDDFNIR